MNDHDWKIFEDKVTARNFKQSDLRASCLSDEFDVVNEDSLDD